MAKILLQSDVHLRYKRPARRRDDFFATQLRKMRQVIAVYQGCGCSAWLQAGDLLDSADEGNQIAATYIHLLKASGIKIYAVRGQHDMMMRDPQSLARTTLGVMIAADVVQLLLPHGCRVAEQTYASGLDFEAGATTVGLAGGGDDTNILVLHGSVGDVKLFADHQLTDPADVQRQFSFQPFDLILCGDYHYPFLVPERRERGVRYPAVLNTGCMSRLTISERDLALHPKVVVFDTTDRSLHDYPLDIEPVEDVFDLTRDEQAPDKETVAALVSELRDRRDTGVSFDSRLANRMQSDPPRPPVRSLIERHLDNGETTA